MIYPTPDTATKHLNHVLTCGFRPGVDDSVSRFHRCTSMSLAGADITDAAIEYLALWVTQLRELTLSFCVQLTDEAIK